MIRTSRSLQSSCRLQHPAPARRLTPNSRTTRRDPRVRARTIGAAEARGAGNDLRVPAPAPTPTAATATTAPAAHTEPPPAMDEFAIRNSATTAEAMHGADPAPA